MSLTDLRTDVLVANRTLVAHGLVHASFGNVSGVDRSGGVMVIKPSGVPYDELSPDTMSVVDIAGGRHLDGLRPSSDTPTHLELYRAFPGIGGVAHTHSTFATIWAQACLPVPCLGTTHADHFRGDIPCTRALSKEEIEGAYEHATGRVIIEALAGIDAGDMPGLLVASHGPFAWGEHAATAVATAAALELVAAMAYHTLALRPDQRRLADALRERHFLRKHGAGAYYGQATRES